MRFLEHGSDKFVCILSNEELQTYEIELDDEVNHEICNPKRPISGKLRHLIDDVMNEAKGKYGCELSGALLCNIQIRVDGSLRLEVKKVPPVENSENKRDVTWEILGDIRKQHGCALIFQSLSETAAYLRIIGDALKQNKSIVPTLYRNKGVYALDIVYLPELQNDKDDNAAFRHIFSAAVEYADKICISDHNVSFSAMMDEHWSLIAAYPEEFEMLMEY